MTETFLRESTKFRVLSAPIQVPGVCASCGSSSTDDRNYVDFDMFVDYVGVIYFCTFCFDECANALGYISPEQARVLEAKLEAAEKKILDFYTKDRALNDAINLLRDSGLFDLVDGAASASNEVPSSEVNGSSKQDDLGTNESDKHNGKQDSEQGSPDLSATGDDELFGLGIKL
jgi:hypothetical protein